MNYFNALKHESTNCEQFPAFNDEQTEMEVSMDIEEAQQSDDECFGEEYVSQRQAEMDFKLEISSYIQILGPWAGKWRK